MTDYDSIDFFTDQSLISNPYPYFEHLRAKCSVLPLPPHGVVAVTGYEEANAVYTDFRTFSSIVAVGGPFPPLPFEPQGDEIGEQVEQHRDQMPMSQYLTTMDPPEHSRARSLLSRLLTPQRLQGCEDFMRRLADEQLDHFIANRRCEFVSEYAKPFSLRVIADLLGVAAEDREALGAPRPGARVGALDHEPVERDRLDWLDERFSHYLAARRREPRADVLTGLATARYPDGSTPGVTDVARIATLVFNAGLGATAVLLSSSLRVLAERPDLAQELRDDRSRIPAFIEEVLRTESPVKADFRLARKTTTLGGVTIPAGTTVMLCAGAIHRDPRRFDDPHEFHIDRPNVRDHLAFGRGVHRCPGARLARAEGRVSVERILDRMSDVRIDEAEHGSAGAHRFTYEPTYTLRALTDLDLTFRPAAAPAAQ